MIVVISIIICLTQNNSCLYLYYRHTGYCPKEIGTLREASSPLRKSWRGIAKNRKQGTQTMSNLIVQFSLSVNTTNKEKSFNVCKKNKISEINLDLINIS